MGQPEQVGKYIQKIFGGFLPDEESVKMARQFRGQLLPKIGACQVKIEFVSELGNRLVEGSMTLAVFKEICRQINAQDIDANKVCAICTFWECPVKKGSVNMSSL